MIGDIREGDTRRNAAGAAERREQRRLADAIGVSRLEHARGAVNLGIGVIEVGIVADLARREIEAPRLLGRRHIRTYRPRSERPDGWMIAIDVFGGREIDRVLVTLQQTAPSRWRR